MDVSKMDDLGKKRVAIAYLVAHIDEVPQDLAKLFAKLKGYESGVTNTTRALQEAKKSIQALQEQFKELLVSVNTVVEMIADDIPEDKVLGWCEKYEPQKNQNTVVTTPKQPVQASEVDMAGSTAKNLPPIPPIKK